MQRTRLRRDADLGGYRPPATLGLLAASPRSGAYLRPAQARRCDRFRPQADRPDARSPRPTSQRGGLPTVAVRPVPVRTHRRFRAGRREGRRRPARCSRGRPGTAHRGHGIDPAVERSRTGLGRSRTCGCRPRSPTRISFPDPSGGSFLTKARKDENTKREGTPATRGLGRLQGGSPSRSFSCFRPFACFRGDVPAVAGAQIRAAHSDPAPDCRPAVFRIHGRPATRDGRIFLALRSIAFRGRHNPKTEKSGTAPSHRAILDGIMQSLAIDVAIGRSERWGRATREAMQAYVKLVGEPAEHVRGNEQATKPSRSGRCSRSSATT